MANLFQEMSDYYMENEYLSDLYDMKDHDIYKEIVLFLDDFRPDWRKNKGLGYYAPEFILNVIEEFECNFYYNNPYRCGEQYELFEDPNKPNLAFRNWLKEMYEYIDEMYSSYSNDYNVTIDEVDEILLDQGITIDDNDYMEKWKVERENLWAKKGEEIYLFF